MEVPSSRPSILGGRYELHEPVGHGGAATVYRATDQESGTVVAIKVLRPELAALVGPERFLQEIEIVRGLRHSNIVPLLDSGESGGTLYYVMPLVSGGTLRGRLQREGPLAIDEAVRVADGVAQALEIAHAAGVVHRDIKPENILFDGAAPLLSDFGIARLVAITGESLVTSAGMILGTPGYMSPEQVAGDRHIDARSDIYSLGCVLFEMLAGEAPFTGPTSQAIAMRHLSERLPSLAVVRPNTPEWLVSVVEASLAKPRADRIQGATRLREGLAGSPRISRRARRLAPWVVGSGVVAVGVVSLVLWLLRSPGGSPPADGPVSIAVLPFTDLSRQQTLGYLAAGLTADLTNDLASISAIKVIAPEVAARLRGRAGPFDSIASALGASTLVTGTVDSVGDSLVIAVQLLDGPSMTRIGSQVVRRRIGDLHQIETAILEEVSVFLRTRLGDKQVNAVPSRLVRNPRAWELARRALSLLDDASSIFHRAGVDRAGPMLDRADSLLAAAQTLVPSSAFVSTARARVAEERALQVDDRAGPAGAQRRAIPRTLDLDGPSWRRIGLAYAARALQIDSLDLDALEARARLRFRLWQGDPEFGSDTTKASVIGDLEAVLDRRPGRASAWVSLSEVYNDEGRFAEADFAAHKALAADPFLLEEPKVMSWLMYAALNLGNSTAAADWCSRGRRRHPGDLRFSGCELMVAAWSSRDVAGAWRLLDALRKIDTLALGPEWDAARLMSVAAVIGRAGLGDSARRTASRALAQAGSPAPPTYLLVGEAQVLVLIGDSVQAIDRIAAAVAMVPQLGPGLRATARFRALHNRPDFQKAVNPPANK